MKHLKYFVYISILFATPYFVASPHDLEMNNQSTPLIAQLEEKSSTLTVIENGIFTLTGGALSTLALYAGYKTASDCPDNVNASTATCTLEAGIFSIVGFPLAVGTMIIGSRFLKQLFNRCCSAATGE